MRAKRPNLSASYGAAFAVFYAVATMSAVEAGLRTWPWDPAERIAVGAYGVFSIVMLVLVAWSASRFPWTRIRPVWTLLIVPAFVLLGAWGGYDAMKDWRGAGTGSAAAGVVFGLFLAAGALGRRFSKRHAPSARTDEPRASLDGVDRS